MARDTFFHVDRVRVYTRKTANGRQLYYTEDPPAAVVSDKQQFGGELLMALEAAEGLGFPLDFRDAINRYNNMEHG